MKTCEPWRTLVIFGLDKPYNLELIIRKKVSFPCFSAKSWASLQHLLFFCFLFSGLSSDGPTSNKYRATCWGHSEFRCLVELLERNIQKRIRYRDFGEQTKSLIVPLLFPEVIPHLQFGLTSVRSCKTHGEIQEPNQQNQIKRIEGWTM